MSNISNHRSQIIDDFCRAVTSLQSIEECYQFFSDIFTVQELTTFSQRLQVARLLEQGDTYETIRKKTSVSSSTITRINTELCYGAGGYRMVIERLHHNEEENANRSSPSDAAFST